MKRKQLFYVAFLAFSHLSSSLILGKENDTKGQGRRSYLDQSDSIRLTPSSFQSNFYENPTPREKETILPVPVDASSSLLDRDLKRTSPKHFFFEECSDTCVASGGVPTILDDDCCEGGVSYLKMKFHAQDQITGTIALGSTHSPSCNHSGPQSSHKGTKAGFYSKAKSLSKSSNYKHRLVNCNAACIKNPFGGSTCNEDPVLSFADGISTKYFSAVDIVLREPDALSYVQDFSIGFNDCGCTCALHNETLDSTPSVVPSVIVSKVSPSSSTPSKVPTATPTLSPSLQPSKGPRLFPTPPPSGNIKSFPTASPSPMPTEKVSTRSKDPTSTPTIFPSMQPSEGQSLFPTSPISESDTVYPTAFPSPMPTEKDFSISTSPIPTDFPTFVVTSSSSPGESGPANPGPGPPTGSSCNSSCAAFILQNCVFIGTNHACDINTEVPATTDDGLEEGAEIGTLRPDAPATGVSTTDDTEEFGNGTKGNKGFGYIGHGKVGKKGEKGIKYGNAFGEESNPDINFGKTNEGKGSKGSKSIKEGNYSSKPDFDRRLKEIEYHQSRINHLKMLLAQIGT